MTVPNIQTQAAPILEQVIDHAEQHKWGSMLAAHRMYLAWRRDMFRRAIRDYLVGVRPLLDAEYRAGVDAAIRTLGWIPEDPS